MASTEPAPRGPKREQQIGVRLADSGLDAIDRLRGNWTRPEWMRQAAAAAIKAGLAGPKGPAL